MSGRHAAPEPEPETVPMEAVRELLADLSWKATRYAIGQDKTSHDVMHEAYHDARYWLQDFRGDPTPCDCVERHITRGPFGREAAPLGEPTDSSLAYLLGTTPEAVSAALQESFNRIRDAERDAR